MAENQFSVAVPNLLQALVGGEQAYEGAKQGRARQEAADFYAKGDTQNALAKLLAEGDSKTITALGHYAAGANGVYGTPIYGVDPETGQTVLGAIGKGGQFQKLDTGGVRITPGVGMLDTGTGYVPYDKRSGVTGAAAVGGPGQPQSPQGMPQGTQGSRDPFHGAVQFPQQPSMQQPGVPGVQPPPMQNGYVPKDIAGKAAAEKLGAETGDKLATMGKAQSSLGNSINGLDRLATQANEVMNHPGLNHATGLLGEWHVPGFSGADAQAKIDTLKSQVGFSVLQAMRDSSKTGGALGQVSDFENRTLQNNLAELQQAQSMPQFKAALKKVIDYTEGAKDRLQRAYDTDYGGLQRPTQASQPAAPSGPAAPAIPKFGEVRDGYRFKGGNPADPSSWVQTR